MDVIVCSRFVGAGEFCRFVSCKGSMKFTKAKSCTVGTVLSVACQPTITQLHACLGTLRPLGYTNPIYYADQNEGSIGPKPKLASSYVHNKVHV